MSGGGEIDRNGAERSEDYGARGSRVDASPAFGEKSGKNRKCAPPHTLKAAEGLAEYHGEHDEVSGERRLANLQELVNGAALYEALPERLADFLEHIA